MGKRILQALITTAFGIWLVLMVVFVLSPTSYDSEIDFAKLRRQNPDVIAYIKIANTPIDYPVLMSGDDKEEDYYLNHNIDGSTGYPGCIYVQKENAKDFSDPVTVLYGHNMKDGSMFAWLHNYEGGAFTGTSPKIIIYTPDKKIDYDIIAVKIYDDRLLLDEYNYFTKQEDMDDFLSDITNVSDTREWAASSNSAASLGDDRFIVLSTCTADDSERLLVIGQESAE